MSRRVPTKHEEAITLYSEPDGATGYFYWATCADHGEIIGRTRDITERTYAVKFHLQGRL